MDIRTMKYFQAVADEGSISNASRHLNIAQPALSRQMKILEEDLGVQLFERGSRKIKLTIAGQLLRERTEQILNLVEGTKRSRRIRFRRRRFHFYWNRHHVRCRFIA